MHTKRCGIDSCYCYRTVSLDINCVNTILYCKDLSQHTVFTEIVTLLYEYILLQEAGDVYCYDDVMVGVVVDTVLYWMVAHTTKKSTTDLRICIHGVHIRKIDQETHTKTKNSPHSPI